MSVPGYWWVGHKDWKRHRGTIARINYNARQQCYFVLVLDGPPYEYGMAYASVVLYSDTEHAEHGDYHLPALPPSDPRNETSVYAKKRKQRHDPNGSPARAAGRQGKKKKQRVSTSRKRKGDGGSDARATPAGGEVKEATNLIKKRNTSKTNSKTDSRVSVLPLSMLFLPSYAQQLFMICTGLTGGKESKGE